MALASVRNALIHLDIYRFNRKMQFGSGLLSHFVSTLASVLAIWPLAAWFGDWRVMLLPILIQSTLSVAISHVVARRPDRLLLDRGPMAQSFSFGWPIPINGLLLFLVSSGDKMIVGRELGMETLAIFAMGTTLTPTPAIVLSKTVASLLLARLSDPLRDTEAGEAVFCKRSLAAFEIYLLRGLAKILGTALLGSWLVEFALGGKFGVLAGLLVAMSITQSLRMMKGGPSLVALARGITTNPMIANLVRVALLPVAWAILAGDGGLPLLIYVATLGETIGAFVAFDLVRRRSGLGLRQLSPLLAIVAAVDAGALTLGHGRATGGVAAMVPPTLLAASMAGLLLAALFAAPNLRLLVWRESAEPRLMEAARLAAGRPWVGDQPPRRARSARLGRGPRGRAWTAKPLLEGIRDIWVGSRPVPGTVARSPNSTKRRGMSALLLPFEDRRDCGPRSPTSGSISETFAPAGAGAVHRGGSKATDLGIPQRSAMLKPRFRHRPRPSTMAGRSKSRYGNLGPMRMGFGGRRRVRRAWPDFRLDDRSDVNQSHASPHLSAGVVGR